MIESDPEEYDYYAERYDPGWDDDRPQRSGRKAGAAKPRKHAPDAAAVAKLAEPTGMEAGFTTTYVPARYEAIWLRESLHSFYAEELITDVQAMVKGGKEASVYRCAGNPTTGERLLAAKVYRPRQFRNLRNDKAYREGRAILTSDGRAAKKTDHRLMRAVGKKTAYGAQVSHTSWLMYEYTTMERLHTAGAAVPKPFAVAENAILMSYIGDELRGAPALNEIHLPKREAAALFDEVLRNIDLLLQHGQIHGDLSAYNLLYWQGRVMLIDFPQVTNLAGNTQAEHILRRDVTRVCEYFSRQGVRCDPSRIMSDLWGRYGDQAQALLDAQLPIEEVG